MDVIVGRKVLLFPLAPVDFEHFIQLHRADKNGYLLRYCLKNMTEDEARHYISALIMSGQIHIFTAMSKEGRASRKIGYVYVSDLSKDACNVSGVMDKHIVRGLTKVLKKDKYTFAQDCFHIMLKICFEKIGVARVQTEVLEKNRSALALVKKENFKKEGVLRNYVRINDRLENVVILSILKEEWYGKAKATINQHPRVQTAGATGV